MQIEPFELERWQSIWENKVELNISESGVHPLTTAELVPDPSSCGKYSRCSCFIRRPTAARNCVR